MKKTVIYGVGLCLVIFVLFKLWGYCAGEYSPISVNGTITNKYFSKGSFNTGITTNFDSNSGPGVAFTSTPNTYNVEVKTDLKNDIVGVSKSMFLKFKVGDKVMVHGKKNNYWGGVWFDSVSLIEE